MKIFLNPGHGGTDPGAVSKSGTKEADISAKVAQILEQRLKLNYYPVQVYQQKKSVNEVPLIENKSNSTLFISIHCNSFYLPNACGVECWYYHTSEKGKKIAEIMQQQLALITGLKNRGAKETKSLIVLKKTKAPAVLVELGFISNPNEEQLLKTKPELFADALWEGIKNLKKEGLI